MTEHRIGTQEEWQAERDELLKEEKELTRRSEELAEKREEELFPDPMAEAMAQSWRGGAVKALERQNAALLEEEPVAS